MKSLETDQVTIIHDPNNGGHGMKLERYVTSLHQYLCHKTGSAHNSKAGPAAAGTSVFYFVTSDFNSTGNATTLSGALLPKDQV